MGADIFVLSRPSDDPRLAVDGNSAWTDGDRVSQDVPSKSRASMGNEIDPGFDDQIRLAYNDRARLIGSSASLTWSVKVCVDEPPCPSMTLMAIS